MGSALLMRRLEVIEPMIKAQKGEVRESIYGVVDKINPDGTPNCVRKWKGVIGDMRETDEDPTTFIIEKLEPLILKHKKYKGVFGGRAGTKSIMFMDAISSDTSNSGCKTFVLRKTMKSLRTSIYAGICGRIKALSLSGFVPTPSQWEIRHPETGGLISFGGMSNIDDIKSSFEYKRIVLEEGHATTMEMLDTLGPTLRGVEGCEMWMAWNAKSANDAMSREFIIPFQAELDRCGYYEDDYHIIIKVGYQDNPWFQYDRSLQEELDKDRQKVEQGRMSKARFAHIWEGAFNDDIENSIIEADWFDACIDAHLKLGFKAQGATVATHDPSDVGNDAKGYACRTGVVFTNVCEIDAENANRAVDVACSMAAKDGADSFGWDCDGLGATLRDQVAAAFKGKKIRSYMFKGSEGVNNPKQIFKAAEDYGFAKAKTNEESIANKRAQNYLNVAERCRKTWEAVTKGVYHNPDDLISFSSDIKDLQKLRSELCKLPIKENAHGKILLYSKPEMRKGIKIISESGEMTEVKIPSPNMGDCVMMSFDKSATIVHNRQQPLNIPIIQSRRL
jgi:phage terminase large subunit